MTDIQRWSAVSDFGPAYMTKAAEGRYVTYADHVEALRQAEQRQREDDNRALWDQRQYEQGQRDALADQFSIGAVLVQRLGGTVIITREEMVSVPLNMTRWEQSDGAIMLSVSAIKGKS
jgi:hypothetical protein